MQLYTNTLATIKHKLKTELKNVSKWIKKGTDQNGKD